MYINFLTTPVIHLSLYQWSWKLMLAVAQIDGFREILIVELVYSANISSVWVTPSVHKLNDQKPRFLYRSFYTLRFWSASIHPVIC